jgi:hypothetical protein
MGMLTILVEPRTNALLAAVAFDIHKNFQTPQQSFSPAELFRIALLPNRQ